jgi:hypothetical protein
VQRYINSSPERAVLAPFVPRAVFYSLSLWYQITNGASARKTLSQMKKQTITFEQIKSAELFEIQFEAASLNKYGSWNLQGEYEDFKMGSLFDSFEDADGLWGSFESWLDNTHVRIMVRNGKTYYEQRWYDGHSWINALGSERTGDDEGTISNIAEMIAAGEWYEICSWDVSE